MVFFCFGAGGLAGALKQLQPLPIWSLEKNVPRAIGQNRDLGVE